MKTAEEFEAIARFCDHVSDLARQVSIAGSGPERLEAFNEHADALANALCMHLDPNFMPSATDDVPADDPMPSGPSVAEQFQALFPKLLQPVLASKAPRWILGHEDALVPVSAIVSLELLPGEPGVPAAVLATLAGGEDITLATFADRAAGRAALEELAAWLGDPCALPACFGLEATPAGPRAVPA